MNHHVRAVGDQTSVADRVVSTRPEKLLDVLAFNNTGGVLYLQVHEASAAPADTAVPKLSFPVQGGLGGTLGRGVDLAAVYVCWSTTALTKTIAAASGSIVAILKA